MTSFTKTNDAVADLGSLKFFPANVRVRLTVVRMIRDMACTDDQVKWLIGRTLQLYNAWEGPRELRALYCSRFKPRDGIEAQSSIYVEGFPAETKSDPKLPFAPSALTADPELDQAVREVAEMKDMNRRAK